MHFWGSCWLLYQQKQGQGGWRGRGSWLFNSFDTHIGLVYDVIAKGCRPQNGSSHCRVLATFRRRPFSKQDEKSNDFLFFIFLNWKLCLCDLIPFLSITPLTVLRLGSPLNYDMDWTFSADSIALSRPCCQEICRRLLSAEWNEWGVDWVRLLHRPVAHWITVGANFKQTGLLSPMLAGECSTFVRI